MKNNVRHISVRKLIFDRDNHVCYICGKRKEESELEIDHVYPVSKGGQTTLKNLRTACKKCNRQKSAKLDFSLAQEYLMEDPSGEAIYIRRDIMTHIDDRFVAAAIRLWADGKLEINKKGIPNG